MTDVYQFTVRCFPMINYLAEAIDRHGGGPAWNTRSGNAMYVNFRGDPGLYVMLVPDGMLARVDGGDPGDEDTPR